MELHEQDMGLGLSSGGPCLDVAREVGYWKTTMDSEFHSNSTIIVITLEK